MKRQNLTLGKIAENVRLPSVRLPSMTEWLELVAGSIPTLGLYAACRPGARLALLQALQGSRWKPPSCGFSFLRSVNY